MELFQLIVYVVLYAIMLMHLIAAAFTKDDTAEIKHVVWATLMAITIFNMNHYV